MERLKYKMKSLIIFFSHRGENYSVGYIKEGNVEHIAKVIKELTNADIYELVPEVPYSENYRECVKQSVKEMQENSRPMFKNPLPNLDGYDLIYLCYPNWCGSFPRIVATFLEKYDFHNKIIKPLCSHEGSGLARSVDEIKSLTAAEVKPGLAIKGTESHTSDDKIREWISK